MCACLTSHKPFVSYLQAKKEQQEKNGGGEAVTVIPRGKRHFSFFFRRVSFFIHNQFCGLLSKCQLTACQPHSLQRERWGLSRYGLKPGHVSHATSLLISEGKPFRAWLVLGLETTWEHQVSSSFSLFLRASVRVPAESIPTTQYPKRGGEYRDIASCQGALSED